MRAASVLLLAGLLGACSGPSPRPAEDAGQPPVRVPADEPGIRGVVTATDGDRLRVETNPEDESGSPKAEVRVGPETRVIFRSGDAAAAAELTLGHNISVWFDGPILESYPVQGVAGTIVIEPAAAP